VIRPGRTRRTAGIELGEATGCGVVEGRAGLVSRVLMRHLLAVRRLRQLLGDDTGQCAENSFSLPDGERHPKLLNCGMTLYLAAARGETMAFRNWRMIILLAEFSAGAPGTTPPIGAALAIR